MIDLQNPTLVTDLSQLLNNRKLDPTVARRSQPKVPGSRAGYMGH